MKSAICAAGRSAVALLAAATILGGICTFTAGAAADQTTSTQPTQTQQTQTTDQDGYYTYWSGVSDQPKGSEIFELLPKDGKTTGHLLAVGSTAETIRLDREAISLTAGAAVSWQIDVPADGLYALYVTYLALPGKGRNLELGFAVDGKEPFSGAGRCELSRIWKYATTMQQDRNGNDLIPKRVEVFDWQTAGLLDTTGYMSAPYQIFLKKGSHAITLTAGEQAFAVGMLTVKAPTQRPDWAQLEKAYQAAGLTKVKNTIVTTEAENTTYQSDLSIYPVYDRAGAATVPNDPARIRRNVIGQANWAKSGMWISYTISDVPKDGLYQLTFKYRQNTQLGMSVFRNIYVNGEIPCKELENVAFPFDFSWQNLTVKDANGNPVWVHLKKGENTIRLEATVGGWDNILQSVSDLSVEMNEVYRRVIMVTSTSPDLYRDYFLEREIEGLTDLLSDMAKRLEKQANLFDAINGSKSNQSETLRRAAEQMAQFAKKPAEIPKRLTKFRDNIATISQWLLANKEQPLELDRFMLHGADSQLLPANGDFWSNTVFSFRQFVAAFGTDYSSLEDMADNNQAITVWVNDGRDQAQILKDLINEQFTTQTNVQVNLNLVQGGLIESTLSGNGPDVAVGVSRGQPVNLACRNALADLTQFSGLEQVKTRFAQDALVPYSYQNGVYALPMTQIYQVLFYRTDILAELGIKVPDTWDDMFAVAAKLQRKNMAVGLPYTSIAATTAVDLGVGAKDLFPTLLMQMGGSYYTDDLSATQLDTPQALAAFKMWTSFYSKYGFDLSYDFNTRFRTGEMPLAVAAYSMYGTLEAAAPEIRGQWAMTAMPGIKQADGSIDRTVGASGSAVVIFRNAKNQSACWKFLDWITRKDVQADFGNATENLLGVAARYTTANLEAVEQLGWSQAERDILTVQRKYVKEVPEVPGSYFTARCIDNAFRDVIYNNANPRTALEEENGIINRELIRKREELGNGKLS